MSQSVLDLVSAIGALVVLVGLMILAFRIEPHWVAKDGRRFICKGQLLDDRGNTQGGWHEYRFRIEDSGHVEGRRRGLVGGRHAGVWAVRHRSDSPPRKKAIFLLHPVHGTGSLLAIRLPESSRAVPVLDALAETPPAED